MWHLEKAKYNLFFKFLLATSVNSVFRLPCMYFLLVGWRQGPK